MKKSLNKYIKQVLLERNKDCTHSKDLSEALLEMSSFDLYNSIKSEEKVFIAKILELEVNFKKHKKLMPYIEDERDHDEQVSSMSEQQSDDENNSKVSSE